MNRAFACGIVTHKLKKEEMKKVLLLLSCIVVGYFSVFAQEQYTQLPTQ